MSKEEKTMQELQGICNAVELLDQTAKQLIHTMDNQLDAIITSDTQKINEFTEEHADLLKQFKANEEAFIAELKDIFPPSFSEKETVRLNMLSKVFPDYTTEIEGWRDILIENAECLQRKQKQVLMLLEFGRSRNEKLISEIFGMLSNKNAHYSSEGHKSGITTGMKINQEV